MNKMPLSQFFAENDKLVHFATLKALKRFKGAGLGDHVEYDEIHGQFVEVFVKSYHSFDPEKATFSTYFVRAATNLATNIIESKYRMDIKTESATGLGSYDESDEGNQDDFFNYDPMIEQQIELEDTVQDVHKNLSPLAGILLQYSINPPDFIYREFLSQREQAAYASSVGLKTHHSTVLDLQFVAKCLQDTVDNPNEVKFIRSAVIEVKKAIRSAVSA